MNTDQISATRWRHSSASLDYPAHRLSSVYGTMSKRGSCKTRATNGSLYATSHYGVYSTPTDCTCSRQSSLPLRTLRDDMTIANTRRRMNKILAKHFMDPADVIAPKDEPAAAVKKDEPEVEYI